MGRLQIEFYFALAIFPPLVLLAILACTNGSRAALWVTIIAAALTIYFGYGSIEARKQWGDGGILTVIMDAVTLPYLIIAAYGLQSWRKRRGRSG